MKTSESEKREILALLALLKDPSSARPTSSFAEFLGEWMLRACLGEHYSPGGDEKNMREELVRLLLAKDPGIWRAFLRPLYMHLVADRPIFDEFVGASPFPDTVVIPFSSYGEAERDYDFSQLRRYLDRAVAQRENGVIYLMEGVVILPSLDPHIVGTDIMGSG